MFHQLCLILKYEEMLSLAGVKAQIHSAEDVMLSKCAQQEQCLYLLSEIRILLAKGEVNRALRFLGFVQGVLWAHNIYSLCDLEIDT